ncbi:MAG: hypothetical protein J5885_00030, partial [Clostridia bacterium]|nr:hypothetical protein [Clostridia bacterium]
MKRENEKESEKEDSNPALLRNASTLLAGIVVIPAFRLWQNRKLFRGRSCRAGGFARRARRADTPVRFSPPLSAKKKPVAIRRRTSF